VRIVRKLEKYFRRPVPIKMMVEDIVDFELSQKCHFCEKEFGSIEKKGNEDKVRDHCRRSLYGKIPRSSTFEV
jgi:hypothetical protein